MQGVCLGPHGPNYSARTREAKRRSPRTVGGADVLDNSEYVAKKSRGQLAK